MWTVPDFDELVADERTGHDRARLYRVHQLLLEAGPPPELAPDLETGPTLAMTLARRSGRRRGLYKLAAAVVAGLLVFLGGYIAGDRGGGSSGAGPRPVRMLELRGTSGAPGAFASLRILPADASGNSPLTLSVEGLPALPAHASYEVYLVRKGGALLPCGAFVVSGPRAAATLSLNAPYPVRGDRWVVTEQLAAATGPGRTMLRMP